LAIAGNKNDMYEHEEVEESEGKELAKEIGAIFQRTSAKESTGVDDLFIKLGKKFINPTASGGSNVNKNENRNKGQKLKSNPNKNDGGKKGGFC
jgi:hypothetical protein